MCEENPSWSNKKIDKWIQLKTNTDFLKSIIDNYGSLHCEYCGKSDLKLYGWCEKSNREDMATVDHFYPKSKFTHLSLDQRNFIVSCYECNSKKEDKLVTVDFIKFPLKLSKINELGEIC